VNGTNEQLWFAGGLDVTVDGASRLVYCVDLLTTINVPGTYNTVTDFADTANLERVGWLMQNEWPTSSYTGATLQTQAAAFQLAIWDITNDSGNGFGTATTRAGIVSQSTDASHPTIAAVLLAANKYEADSLNKTSAYGIVYHNTTIDSNHTIVQTLMGPPPNNPLTATPEPTAVILIFSGLAMIAVGRFRRTNPPLAERGRFAALLLAALRGIQERERFPASPRWKPAVAPSGRTSQSPPPGAGSR